jgi:hypothetical protein
MSALLLPVFLRPVKHGGVDRRVGGFPGQGAQHSIVQPPGEVQQRRTLAGAGGHDVAEQQVVITDRDGRGEVTAEPSERTADPRCSAERVGLPLEMVELGEPQRPTGIRR